MGVQSVIAPGFVLCLAAAFPVTPDQRLISIGERHISVYCEGEPTRLPTVILVPAGGRTAKDWETVQPEAARFTRVCSYDHANFGRSGQAPARLQSVDEVVNDLHAWLQASGEKAPFVMVSHSNSGIYVRRFDARYSRGGLVSYFWTRRTRNRRSACMNSIPPEPRPMQ